MPGDAGAGAEWRVPAQASGIVHGDYLTGNVAFGADGAVRAVFDWELVRRYARLSGRAVSDLPYWVAFSRWRSACIGVGVRARCLDKHMADDGFTGRLLTSAENPDPGSAGSRAILAEAARDALRQGVGFLRRA